MNRPCSCAVAVDLHHPFNRWKQAQWDVRDKSIPRRCSTHGTYRTYTKAAGQVMKEMIPVGRTAQKNKQWSWSVCFRLDLTSTSWEFDMGIIILIFQIKCMCHILKRIWCLFIVLFWGNSWHFVIFLCRKWL